MLKKQTSINSEARKPWWQDKTKENRQPCQWTEGHDRAQVKTTRTTSKAGQWKDRKQEIDHSLGQNKLAYHTLPIAVQIHKQTKPRQLPSGFGGGGSYLLMFNCKPRRRCKRTAEEHDEPPTSASALHLQGWSVASAEVDALPTTIIPCIET